MKHILNIVSFLITFSAFLNFVASINPILVISIDGFQAAKLDKFLTEYPNSALSEIVKTGVRAKYMEPSFPTLTFPNHVTLVTGLNIESHGVVGNAFYDPLFDYRVSLTGDATIAAQEQWWNQSEPVWMTARKMGLKTGAFFWAGSTILRRSPDIYMTYSDSFPYDIRIDEVCNWISKLKMDLTFLYFNQPDSAGHTYGPESQEYFDQIKVVDYHLGTLIQKFKELKIYDKVNMVVLSDHGMAQMGDDSIVEARKYIPAGMINSTRTVYNVVGNIHPTPGNLSALYEAFKQVPHATVYYKNEVPARFSYSNNDRIGPLVVVADEGYIVLNSMPSNLLRGNHGFDNTLHSMRTIFMARGPNFKRNMTIEPFRNVNVYSLLCKLLDINALPNNGTIEPFKNALNYEPSRANNFYSSKLMFAFLGFFYYFINFNNML